jgi:hypothetical protein
VKKDDKEFTNPTRCDHCGNVGPMEVVGNHSRTTTDSHPWTASDGEDCEYSWDETTTYSLYICQACHQAILKIEYWDERYPEDSYSKLLYPQPDTMGTVLPPLVGREYDAAVKVRSINANAYAVLLGRVVDKVCEDRKAKGDTLFDKLQDLAAKGEIPTTLVEMSHGLRQLRNVGAHADLGDLTAQEIKLLDAIIRTILEYVYPAPKLLEEVRSNLAKRKGPPVSSSPS